MVREALSSFPSDTQQLIYTNLAQLRTLPDYNLVLRRLLNRQLRGFGEFLRSMGTNPETDIDEIVQGWRGQPVDSAASFGLAEGRFQPDHIRKFYAQQQLPFRDYAGLELYAFGSGEDRADLFFAFLSPTLAAFGRRHDLKAILDVRAGMQPALDSNAAFLNWEAEVEGTAAQWGIATGKAAVNVAAPWLLAGGKLSFDLSAILSPVQAVLFRVDWGQGFSTRLSILCQSAESAEALAQLLKMLREARETMAGVPEGGMFRLLQGLEIQASGSRIELSCSGPLESLDPVLGGTASGPAS